MIHDLKDILVKESTKIESAMNLIGKASLRTLLVADSGRKLLGTITDGDIRRALIKGKSLDRPVSEIMNKNPITSEVGTSKQELLRIMTQNKILTIPIINNSGQIEDIESILNITQIKKIENTVLIMAGGFGKRLGYLTKDIPKPLLSIEEAPLLEKIVKNLVSVGFYKILISTHYKAELIKEHFGNGEEFGAEISYLDEKEPLGTGGCLRILSKEQINNLPLMITNADLVTKIDYKSFLEFHLESKCQMTMGVSHYEHSVPYGVVHLKDDNLQEISEKPKEKYFINAGIYLIEPQVLDDLDPLAKKFNMTDLANHLLNLDHQVKIFPIHEYWRDVGNIQDFKAVQKDLSD